MKLLILLLIGIAVGYWFGKRHGLKLTKGATQENVQGEAKESLIAKQAKEKEENKQSILELLETQSPLTNNNIEALLGVSDSTATRYLEELEKEGRVRQVGKTGKGVHYEKI